MVRSVQLRDSCQLRLLHFKALMKNMARPGGDLERTKAKVRSHFEIMGIAPEVNLIPLMLEDICRSCTFLTMKKSPWVNVYAG